MGTIVATANERARRALRARLGGHIALRLAEMSDVEEIQGPGIRLQLLGAPQLRTSAG
jgi:hypothetical protein